MAFQDVAGDIWYGIVPARSSGPAKERVIEEPSTAIMKQSQMDWQKDGIRDQPDPAPDILALTNLSCV